MRTSYDFISFFSTSSNSSSPFPSVSLNFFHRVWDLRLRLVTNQLLCNDHHQLYAGGSILYLILVRGFIFNTVSFRTILTLTWTTCFATLILWDDSLTFDFLVLIPLLATCEVSLFWGWHTRWAYLDQLRLLLCPCTCVRACKDQNSEAAVFTLKNHVELTDGFRILGKMFYHLIWYLFFCSSVLYFVECLEFFFLWLWN